jgi:hypothetical protein
MGHLLGAPPAPANCNCVNDSPTDTLLWTAVSAVILQSPSSISVHAFAIDTPIAGERTPGAGVEINGWVIGQSGPLVGVRAVSNDGTGDIHPLDVRRPDVAVDYPKTPHADASGFSFWLPLPDCEGPWRVTIEALPAAGQPVNLVELRGEIIRERRALETGMRHVRAPDFAIIGTQRGGTTSLHAYLSAHPMVQTPPTKELHFVTDRFARGHDWYLGQFPSQLKSDTLTGESTPYALSHPLAAQRLHAVAPDTKLIVLLRNPIDRAYSHYLLERSRGDESLSFAEALDAEEARLAGEEERLIADPSHVSAAHKHASYMSRGNYAPQLARWFAVYPRAQFLVLRSEDLYERTAATFARVEAFLGLPAAEDIPFVAHNPTAGPPLDPVIRDRLARHFAPLNERLGRLLGWDMTW